MFAAAAAIGAITGIATGQIMEQEWRKQYDAASPEVKQAMLQAKQHAQLLSAIRDSQPKCGCQNASGWGSGFLWGTILSR